MSEPFDPQILDLLLRRYAPGEEQKCRLCGRPMRHYQDIGLEMRSYRCATPLGNLSSVVDWARHRVASELVVNRKPDPEVVALVEAYRAMSTSRSETVRKALGLAEHLAGVLGSAEVLNAVCELRMEEAATRPYQPELRWAPYQEFASDPGLETMEPPAGAITVHATGYRDNYVIIYWVGEVS